MATTIAETDTRRSLPPPPLPPSWPGRAETDHERSASASLMASQMAIGAACRDSADLSLRAGCPAGSGRWRSETITAARRRLRPHRRAAASALQYGAERCRGGPLVVRGSRCQATTPGGTAVIGPLVVRRLTAAAGETGGSEVNSAP